MSEPTRSLADELRRFDDERLTELLLARPDLSAPVPRGIGPLAARAAGAASVQRALGALTRPELSVLEALAVLEDPTCPADVAAAVGATPAEIAGVLDRLRTLALVRGQSELRAVRTVREVLRTPAGLAPEADDDPSPAEAARRLREAPPELEPLFERLAWGPAKVDAAEGSAAARVLGEAGVLVRRGDLHLIPRPVHLALRGGRVCPAITITRPLPEGEAIRERIPGTRDAQSVEAAFEAVRLVGTVRTWDDDPPAVLRRGGIPQRDLRRLAQQADAPLDTYTTVIQTAWCAGLLGHDGESWQPTADWDAFRTRGLEQRWAELALTWARCRHLAVASAPADPQHGQARAALSSASARDGLRTRRLSILRALRPATGIHATEASLAASLGWAFPLVAPTLLAEEVHAALVEGTALGVVLDGALTTLGTALVDALEKDVESADGHLADVLRALAPPPVDELLLDADLTATIPGRPSERLLALLPWTDVVSRGGAMTLRFTAATIRRAMGAGLDGDDLLALLRDASRTPVPQTLEYLLRDEARRHGQIRIGRAAAYLTADEDVLTLFQGTPHAEALHLQRLAPTVAITASDPGFVLQMVRRSGLSAIAVGPDGLTARDERDHSLHGGPVEPELETVEGPELRLPAAEAVSRIRQADAGDGEDLSVTDRLLEAIAHGQELRLGIVDGRGGIIARDAVPLSLEGGRLRARDARGAEEFTVLVHRVTLG